MRDPLILIVEDHPMMVDALCGNLRELIPTAQFFEAGSLAHGLQLLAQYPQVDLLLLDLNLPDAEGLNQRGHNDEVRLDLVNCFG